MLCVLSHEKVEALRFKIYKNDVEIQIGYNLKRLRMDKGGEHYYPSYFQSMGIIHKTTTEYTHHNQIMWRRGKIILFKRW